MYHRHFLDLNSPYKRELYKYDVMIACFHNAKFERPLTKKTQLIIMYLKLA